MKGKKVKLSLWLSEHHIMKMYCWVEVYLRPYLTSALDGREWSASRPGVSTFITHCTGDWVGARSGLDAVQKGKPLAPARNSTQIPRSSSPSSSHYTAWAIQVLICTHVGSEALTAVAVMLGVSKKYIASILRIEE
jgi:hypothetical protein